MFKFNKIFCVKNFKLPTYFFNKNLIRSFKKMSIHSGKFISIRKRKASIHKHLLHVFIYIIALILSVSIISNFSLNISNYNLNKLERLIHQELMLSSKIQVYSLQTNILFQRYLTGNNSIDDVRSKLNELDKSSQLFLHSFETTNASSAAITKKIEELKETSASLKSYIDKLPTTFIDHNQATQNMHVLLSLDRLEKMNILSKEINMSTIDYSDPIIQSMNKQNNLYSTLSLLIATIAIIISIFFVISITSNIKNYRNSIHVMTEELVTETNELIQISSHVKNDSLISNQHLLTILNDIDTLVSETDTIGTCIDEVSTGISHVSMLNKELAISSDESIDFVNKTKEIISSFKSKLNTDMADIHTIIHKMDTSLCKIGQATDRVLILSDKINAIQNILTSISNISKRTNLLAINASIEAAQAGEYGRGFTIVANEIRNLSIQSSTNSKEIETIIKELILFSSTTINSLKESTQDAISSVSETKKITSILEDTNHVFSSIVDHIEEIRSLSNNISDHSYKTNDKAEHINTYSQNISANTQNFLCSIQEFACTLTEVTSTLKTSLNGVHNQFELLDHQKNNIEDIYQTVKKL